MTANDEVKRMMATYNIADDMEDFVEQLVLLILVHPFGDVERDIKRLKDSRVI